MKPELTALETHQWAKRLTALVEESYGIAAIDLVGPRRFKRLSEARFVLCWLMRQAGASYPEIGHQLGRDHTTIINAVRAVEKNERVKAGAAALWSEHNKRLGHSVRFACEPPFLSLEMRCG